MVCLATFVAIQAWGVEKGMMAGLVLAALSFTISYAQARRCCVLPRAFCVLPRAGSLDPLSDGSRRVSIARYRDAL